MIRIAAFGADNEPSQILRTGATMPFGTQGIAAIRKGQIVNMVLGTQFAHRGPFMRTRPTYSMPTTGTGGRRMPRHRAKVAQVAPGTTQQQMKDAMSAFGAMSFQVDSLLDAIVRGQLGGVSVPCATQGSLPGVVCRVAEILQAGKPAIARAYGVTMVFSPTVATPSYYRDASGAARPFELGGYSVLGAARPRTSAVSPRQIRRVSQARMTARVQGRAAARGARSPVPPRGGRVRGLPPTARGGRRHGRGGAMIPGMLPGVPEAAGLPGMPGMPGAVPGVAPPVTPSGVPIPGALPLSAFIGPSGFIEPSATYLNAQAGGVTPTMSFGPMPAPGGQVAPAAVGCPPGFAWNGIRCVGGMVTPLPLPFGAVPPIPAGGYPGYPTGPTLPPPLAPSTAPAQPTGGGGPTTPSGGGGGGGGESPAGASMAPPSYYDEQAEGEPEYVSDEEAGEEYTDEFLGWLGRP